MTTQSDPRIAELQELAANEGKPLALRPEAIIQLEDDGACVDPFSGQCAIPVVRWLTARGRAVAVQLALVLLVLLTPMPASAGDRGPRTCIHRNHATVCRVRGIVVRIRCDDGYKMVAPSTKCVRR
jgi:hypothetical protein